MKKRLICLFIAGLVCTASAAPKKVLVVTVTTGFRHSSIETAEKIIAKIGDESGVFTVDYARVTPPKAPRRSKPEAPKETGDAGKDKAAKEKYEADLATFQADDARFKEAEKSYTEDRKKVLAEKMSPAALKNYDAIVFANTTGDLPLPDNQAFIDWVKAGHGFVAMHSGSDTFHGFKPYIEMLGGEFQTHGAQEVVNCLNVDPLHPATKHFGASFDIGGKKEEIYIIKSYAQKAVRELLVLDKHPNTKAPGSYPISWCREFGAGKVFYTSLGHNEYVWEMPEYQTHILGGIKWALGLEKADATPQAK